MNPLMVNHHLTGGRMTSHGKFHLACHAKAQKCVQGPMLEQLQGKLGQGLRRCKMEQRIEIQQAILLGRLNCILAEERVLRPHRTSEQQQLPISWSHHHPRAPLPRRVRCPRRTGRRAAAAMEGGKPPRHTARTLRLQPPGTTPPRRRRHSGRCRCQLSSASRRPTCSAQVAPPSKLPGPRGRRLAMCFRECISLDEWFQSYIPCFPVAAELS